MGSFNPNLKKYELNPIQDRGEGGKKALRTSFSPVTSTNVRFGPQNLLCHTSAKFQVYTYCQSQIIEPEPRPLLKNSDFSGQILITLRL